MVTYDDLGKTEFRGYGVGSSKPKSRRLPNGYLTRTESSPPSPGAAASPASAQAPPPSPQQVGETVSSLRNYPGPPQQPSYPSPQQPSYPSPQQPSYTSPQPSYEQNYPGPQPSYSFPAGCPVPQSGAPWPEWGSPSYPPPPQQRPHVWPGSAPLLPPPPPQYFHPQKAHYQMGFGPRPSFHHAPVGGSYGPFGGPPPPIHHAMSSETGVCSHVSQQPYDPFAVSDGAYDGFSSQGDFYQPGYDPYHAPYPHTMRGGGDCQYPKEDKSVSSSSWSWQSLTEKLTTKGLAERLSGEGLCSSEGSNDCGVSAPVTTELPVASPVASPVLSPVLSPTPFDPEHENNSDDALTLFPDEQTVLGDASRAAAEARDILRDLQIAARGTATRRTQPGAYQVPAWGGPSPAFGNIPVAEPIVFSDDFDSRRRTAPQTERDEERLLSGWSSAVASAEERGALEDMRRALTPIKELVEVAEEEGGCEEPEGEGPECADTNTTGDTAALSDSGASAAASLDGSESSSTDPRDAERKPPRANPYDLPPCAGYLGLALPVDNNNTSAGRVCTTAAANSADGGASTELFADLGLKGWSHQQRVEETIRSSLSKPGGSDQFSAKGSWNSQRERTLREAAETGTVHILDEDEEALREFGPVDVDEERFIMGGLIDANEIASRYSSKGRKMDLTDKSIYQHGREDFEATLREVNARVLELMAEGQPEGGIPMYRALLQSHQGEYHDKEKPLVASALHNLAILHLAGREYDEAQRYCRFAAQMRRAFLGPKHQDVASSLSMMGVIYYAKGKMDKALRSLRKGLEFARDTLGHSHPMLARMLNNIGCVYFEMGSLTLSLSNFEESLDVQRTLVGKSEAEGACTAVLDISTTLCNMALASVRRGRVELAASLLEEGLTVQQSVLGDDDMRVRGTERLLEIVCCAKGKVDASVGDSERNKSKSQNEWTSFGSSFP